MAPTKKKFTATATPPTPEAIELAQVSTTTLGPAQRYSTDLGGMEYDVNRGDVFVLVAVRKLAHDKNNNIAPWTCRASTDPKHDPATCPVCVGDAVDNGRHVLVDVWREIRIPEVPDDVDLAPWQPLEVVATRESEIQYLRKRLLAAGRTAPWNSAINDIAAAMATSDDPAVAALRALVEAAEAGAP